MLSAPRYWIFVFVFLLFATKVTATVQYRGESGFERSLGNMRRLEGKASAPS